MKKDLINRITYYLSSGGLFNPELADHLAVRNLLMECREALAQPEQEPVPASDTSEKRVDETAKQRHEREPEQEPVAWDGDCVLGHCGSPAGCEASNCCRANYTAPPQRTWVGLTQEELSEIYNRTEWDTVNGWEYERAIEAKLKEKNL